MYLLLFHHLTISIHASPEFTMHHRSLPFTCSSLSCLLCFYHETTKTNSTKLTSSSFGLCCFPLLHPTQSFCTLSPFYHCNDTHHYFSPSPTASSRIVFYFASVLPLPWCTPPLLLALPLPLFVLCLGSTTTMMHTTTSSFAIPPSHFALSVSSLHVTAWRRGSSGDNSGIRYSCNG